MTRRNLAFALTVLGLVVISSPNLDARAQGRSNPVRLEGQIREIGVDGEFIVIRLHRDRLPLVADPHQRVRTEDDQRLTMRELQVGDSIRVDGDQYPDFIRVSRATLLLRVQRR